MAVPKRKTSRARKRSRCTHQVEKIRSFTSCLNCHEPVATHQVCLKCGFYKGVKMLTTKAERAVKRAGVSELKQARQNAAMEKKQANQAPVEAQVESTETK